MIRFLATIFLFTVLCSRAQSQQEVTFPQAPSERLPVWRDYGEQVTAILSLPPNAGGKLPAVVLIHSRAAYDPVHYAFYGVPLRQAGIATLELILYRGGRPSHRPSDLVPHAFGALKYLASHPRIDANRIGVLGFSLGGMLAMFTASDTLATESLGSGGPRFAAHMPVYPLCWVHEEIAQNTERMKRFRNVYAKLSGAPIHILAGGKDQWDDPDSCQKFLEMLSPVARNSIALTYYPGATHGWDREAYRDYYGEAACKGRGCQVNDVGDPDTARKGRQVVIDFFTSVLLQAQTK